MFLTPAPKLLSPTVSSRKGKQSYSAPLPTRSTARYHHSCNRMKKPAQLFSLKTKAKVVRFSETVVAAVSAAHSPEKLRDRNLHSVKPPSLHENRNHQLSFSQLADLGVRRISVALRTRPGRMGRIPARCARHQNKRHIQPSSQRRLGEKSGRQ